MKTPEHKQVYWSAAALLPGIFLVLVALGIVDTEPDSAHAPMWVIGLCGTMFLVAGIMMIVGQHSSRWNNLLAGVLCLSFAAVGFWVALFSPTGGFSGGIPFVSHATNIILARGMFGFGAVMSLLVSVYAFKLAINNQAS